MPDKNMANTFRDGFQFRETSDNFYSNQVKAPGSCLQTNMVLEDLDLTWFG